MAAGPLRVALLSAEYPPRPGGVGDYTRQLGQALLRRGHLVTVLTGTAAERAPEPPPVCTLPIGAWGWGCWRAVVDALGRLRPDVLHIQYQTGAYAMHPAINLLPWRLRRLAPRPLIAVTAHDLLPPYLFPKAGPLRDQVTRRLLVDADVAVVTNPDDQRRAAAWRPATLIPIGSNIAVAPPPGYDRDAWRARLGVAAGETLIAYFGLISRSKGLDVLLDALARLPAAVRLLVVGGAATAPEDRAFAAAVHEQVGARALGGRVAITGHCAPEEVSAHLLAADLAALPFADGASFRRGSLLAALAHGLPTVTTRAPGAAPPALVDGAQALLVPPGDVAALAAALARLAADAALRARLGAQARALAAGFSWEAIAAQHEQLYAAAAPATPA